jgi:hypothetical protein
MRRQNDSCSASLFEEHTEVMQGAEVAIDEALELLQ